MADEILMAALGDQRQAEYLSNLVALMYADRNALFGHPVLQTGYLGDVQGKGSLTLKRTLLGMYGFDSLTAVAENTDAPTIALSDDSVTALVARHAGAYNISAQVAMTDGQGTLSREEMWVQNTVACAGMTLTSLIAGLADDFTAQETPGTGTDMDLATIRRGVNALRIANAPVDQGILGILHTKQWNDVMDELLAAGAGTIAWTVATPEQLAVRGPGYEGRLFGKIDIFTTTKTVTINAAADHAGVLLAPGAVAWADGTDAPDGDINKLNLGRGIQYARAFDNSKAMKSHIMNYNCGASVGIDAGGVCLYSGV